MADTDPDLVALALLVEPVRRDLYDWVVAQARPVGREEAATALKITRALATFHLDRLAAAGLLEAGYRRLSGRVGPGAGRPARVYWRADREFSVSLPDRRYERVAQLFALTLERLDDKSVPDPLQDAARELGEQLGATGGRGAPGNRLTAALKAGGYEPVTVKGGSNPSPQLPLRCTCRRAPTACVRYEPGSCRRHHSRLWRNHRPANPRLPAGPVLRRIRARHGQTGMMATRRLQRLGRVLRAGDLGALVCEGACVQRVEHS